MRQNAKRMSLERAKKISSSVAPKNTDIVSGVSIMDKRDLELTKRKFQVAYFVAKHQLSMTKYAEILKLEEMHGVEIGAAYHTDRYCGTFIDYCSDDIKSLLNSDLCDANFYSVLSDGSTDSAVKENEVIYVLYFDPTPIGSDSVEVKVSFLQMNYLQDQSATSVKAAIESGFQSLGIILANKLVGFTSDGASVNRGDKNSVKTLLQDDYSWLVFIWCIAHRLELALEDALKGTRFDVVDEMLLHSYYLYQKAPKKLRQLRELFEMYRGAMDYLSDSCKPKKASGTRCISHKLGAMKTVLDKWGLYIQHLENLTEDKST